MLKRIENAPNTYTEIDQDVYDELQDKKFYLSKYGYVVYNTNGGQVRLHRHIMNTPKGLECDHIDRDKLNNTRSNLRNCTKRQNMGNFKRKEGKSTLAGVSFNRSGKPYANISINGKMKRLGTYETVEEAHAAYVKEHTLIHRNFSPYSPQ